MLRLSSVSKGRGNVYSEGLKRNGLTLLETLAVLVILAILGIFLMGAVKKFQKRAQTSACSSNLRQLGAIICQFSTDHNGDLLPTLQRTDPKTGSGIVWFQILNESGTLPFETWERKLNSIMRCPSRTSPNPRGYPNSLPSRDYNGSHYGMNTYPGADNMIAVDGPRIKMAAIQHPSRTLLLSETDWTYQIYPTSPTKRIYPHDGGCNLLFADGHAEFHPGELPVYSPAQLKPDANIPPFLGQ